MELLELDSYHKVFVPLKELEINTLFARAVVERRVKGEIFVDNANNPSTFYIVHPYGMSLLFGNTQNELFNEKFLEHSLNTRKLRSRHEWMQAFPREWNTLLARLYSDNLIHSAENLDNKEFGVVELNTRVNFRFNRQKFLTNPEEDLPAHCEIVPTNKDLFLQMNGVVVPSLFWDTADDFLKYGVGFSLLFNGELATTAYSAYFLDDKLEIGIETIPDFRGKGFARLACAALINHCIKNGYEPVWSCRKENIASVQLAQKLGFEVSFTLPYYRLSK